MKLDEIIDKKKATKDKNGIWISDSSLSKEVQLSKKAWEKIYNFSDAKLKEDRFDFNKNKLADHVSYIEQAYTFSSKTIYLEIGCGPAYIAEYLMKKYDCTFVGVDLNYPMLLTLKNYLTKKGYKNFILVHADINQMPIKESSIDFIYGGGVIEHTPDTTFILKKLYKILKKGGVSFNTVPAFNIQWISRSYNNIPSIAPLKSIFETVHLKFLHSKVLEKYYGYELSFPLSKLENEHEKVQFKHIQSGAFAFHPSTQKLKNDFLRQSYYTLSKSTLLCPMYYAFAEK